MELTHGLAQEAANPVANHCIAQRLGGHKTIPVMVEAVGHHTEEKAAARNRLAFRPQPCKIAPITQPKTPLHPLPLRLPVHFLHMVRLDGQHMAAMGAARLQHLATTACLHPLAETMHTFATADLRLVCPFGCHKISGAVPLNAALPPFTYCCVYFDRMSVKYVRG